MEKNSEVQSALFRIVVWVEDVSATLPEFHHSSTRPIKMQQVMITTVIHPAAVHGRLCIYRSTSRVRLQNAQRSRSPLPVLPKARNTREMYSVSIVSYEAELGRPPICLKFNSSHNITKRFPSRCFVIKSAGLCHGSSRS